MAKHIYLFQEHQNFQVGKTQLKKAAVFETNFLWLTIWLLIVLGCLWAGGYAIRQSWHFSQTGKETTGIVTNCNEIRGSKGGYHTNVTYRYTVSERSYTDTDSVGGGQQCNTYSVGRTFPVYYLSDMPTEAGINSFLHETEWLVFVIFGIGGLIGMVVLFVLLMQNREERYKYALLQHANTLFEARIKKVGAVSGKNGYYYADYRFASSKGNFLNGQIRSGKGYNWQKDIQVGDTLSILYFDDKTNCVL